MLYHPHDCLAMLKPRPLPYLTDLTQCFWCAQVYYMDSTFAMGHVVIRRKRTVVGDENPDVILFRCIQNMNPVYPYNTCYTGGEPVFIVYVIQHLRAAGRKENAMSRSDGLKRIHFHFLRYCEAEGGGPLGAADPSFLSQCVPGWRLHLPGCCQTGLKCVTSLWTPGMLLWNELCNESQFEWPRLTLGVSVLAEWFTVWLLACSAWGDMKSTMS